MTFDWGHSYRTEWKLVPIDPKTWEGYEDVPRLKEFKLKTNSSGKAPTIQSGSFSVDDVEVSPGWYRIVAKMIGADGTTTTIPISTMAYESDGSTNDYGIDSTTMTGQSVLYPAANQHIEIGDFIPKHSDGAEWCRDRLAHCTPAPVVIDSGSFRVERNYVFDSGTSYLEAVWKLLDSASWVIRIDGDGVVHLRKKSTIVPDFEMTQQQLSIFKPGIDRTMDLSAVPNLYKVRYNGRRAVAVNDDPNSISSSVSRMYVKDVIDTDPILLDGETIEHYANRMLEEQSTLIRQYSYNREIWAEFQPFDLVYYNIPGVFTANARVISQSYSSQKNGGLSINEVVGEEVKLWTAPTA